MDMKSQRYTEIALGHKEADLVLKHAKIVNVFSSSIEEADIAIHDGIIIGIGTYQGKEEIDLHGKYVAPGFIDGHVHIESSMLTPPQFAKIVMEKGTTTCIIDPHEIGNVLGIDGIKYMIESSKRSKLEVHVMLPSCVPTTNFETAGAVINNKEILKIKDNEHVLGLGEVMDYPSVIEGERDMHLKIDAMKDRPIDGHAPLVSGSALNAYTVTGIKTDHECTTVEEMHEKINRGMYILLREGSATRNVRTLAKGVTKDNQSRCLFCTDDKHPADIKQEGHINYNIKIAIEEGVEPITAIRMATLHTALAYGLHHLGAIAPSYQADLVVFDSLTELDIIDVYKKGELVVKEKKALFEPHAYLNQKVVNTVKLRSDKAISLDLKLKQEKVYVLGLIENNVTTQKLIRTVTVENGLYQNNTEDDIIKLAVIERHKYTGNVGLGLVEGYGLKEGAVAMTIAHDSHNIILIGDNDNDMHMALHTIKEIGGGIVLVHNQEVVDTLPLEIAGLMTNEDAQLVEDKLHHMEDAIRKMGVKDTVDDPFLTLAFLSLPVIPALKVTDQGLFDVATFKLIPMEVK